MKKVLLSALIVAAQAGMIFTTQAEQSPQTVNIGFQKANIFALLKYRRTLDESFKKQGIAVRWVEVPRRAADAGRIERGEY